MKYQADFQLVMTNKTCPCGNYLSDDKVCLCRSESIIAFWKKVLNPLGRRIDLIVFTDKNDKTDYSVKELKKMIENKDTDFSDVDVVGNDDFYKTIGM